MIEESPTAQLSAFGVSIWLDDLSRERMDSGSLATLIAQRNVVGVTTNPTIFAAALTNGPSYAGQIGELARADKTAAEAVFEITTRDVSNACDIFADIYRASQGRDGRVSIEVEPGLAHDAEGTIAQAKQLFAKVAKPNVMIKIPATTAGLTAITEATAQGISVNVTLIFSLARYRAVIDAYLNGLEKALQAGIDISQIHSVASFFVSRVDTEIDRQLVAIGTDEALSLRGKAGVANARLAYSAFQQAMATERVQHLLAAGANVQRPLWASTGVKDPLLADTMYVTELVAPGAINTMPEKTLHATFDHGVIAADSITGTYPSSREIMESIADQGISYDEVTELLEIQAAEKFVVAWNELLETVEDALKAPAPTT